jgi:uncharacterized membrane protein
MKQFFKSLNYKAILLALTLINFQTVLFAQNTQVEVNGHDVGSWFSRNWLWVTIIVVVLVLIILFSSSSSRNSRTTTVTDHNGNIKRTTTTEVNE